MASLFQDQEDMLAELEALQLELNSTTAVATHSEGAEDDALFEKRLAEWENRREEAEMELARQQAVRLPSLRAAAELLLTRRSDLGRGTPTLCRSRTNF